MPEALVGGGAQPYRRRVKQFVALHLRQIPCFHAAVEAVPQRIRCWKRRNYQTLGQDEEGDGSEETDERQVVNATFGKVVVKVAMLGMVGITVLLIITNSKYEDTSTSNYTDWSSGLTPEQIDDEEFRRDAPLVLYIAALELLVCGACAQTAAMMYTRRRHALKHPKDSEGRERQRYIQVDLEKEPGRRDAQLFGIGFRPSTDGLECLLIEEVRPNSLLGQWNRNSLRGGARSHSVALLEEAFGDSVEVVGNGAGQGGAAEAEANADDAVPGTVVPVAVHAGAAIVAVNGVCADVGMMQAELTKAQVTLWIRSEVYHPSRVESEVLAEPFPGAPPGGPMDSYTIHEMQQARAAADAAAPAPTSLGRPENGHHQEDPPTVSGPRCACLGFEDEEPQILTRWLVCSILFGWVTILPVLLMQPHEERPRQHLFREYLLKPCMLIMPIWLLAWIFDCVEVAFKVKIMHPFFYFGMVHMILPAALVWYLMKVQVADETLVLEQRKSRQAEVVKEASKVQPVAVEDPSPTFLKELICVNPVALVWLGSVASIPILVCSFLAPLKTARARLAQAYVNILYAPMVFMQLAFVWILWRMRWLDLPKLYLAGFGLLLSVPCFIVWCFCLMCASRYGRQDMQLVQKQRTERAKEVVALLGGPAALETGSASAAGAEELVDCTEAVHREWELIFTV